MIFKRRCFPIHTAVVAATAGLFLSACAAPQPGVGTPERDGVDAPYAASGPLASVRISHDLTGSVLLNATAGGWVVAEDGFPADSTRVARALDELSGLHDQERIAGASAAVDYGLDPDRATVVELTDGEGRTRRLSLGKGADGYGTTYWSEEGRDGIFRVDGNKSWGLPTDPEHWKSRSIFPPFSTGTQPWGVRMTWRDTGGNQVSYRLVRLSVDSAILVEPDTMTVPSVKAFDLLGRVMQVAVDDFIEVKERRKLEAGLSAKGAVIATMTVWMENGERYSTRIVGRADDHYYVEHPSGALAKMKRWRLEDLTIPPEALAAPLPLGPDPDDGTARHILPPGIGVYVPHGFDPEGEGHGHADEGEAREDHHAPHEHGGDDGHHEH